MRKRIKKKVYKARWTLGATVIILILTLCAIESGDQVLSHRGFEAESLGQVRVTRYSHFEGGRLTASGYILKDSDDGKVCAVGRDWFRVSIKVDDKIWVEGFKEPCVVKDTMAIRNHKGLLQNKWVDVYIPDPVEGLKFGIQKRRAYKILERST